MGKRGGSTDGGAARAATAAKAAKAAEAVAHPAAGGREVKPTMAELMRAAVETAGAASGEAYPPEKVAVLVARASARAVQSATPTDTQQTTLDKFALSPVKSEPSAQPEPQLAPEADKVADKAPPADVGISDAHRWHGSAIDELIGGLIG